MTRDGPLWLVALSVASGASLGALLRWGLSYLLNPMSGWMPMGTFAANVLGGFLIGMALAWTAASPGIPPALRLFLITGFLGGLTTFSTLSGEAFDACEYIMDWLKTEAPFWKKESTPEGERWVDARESDDQAKARWEEW